MSTHCGGEGEFLAPRRGARSSSLPFFGGSCAEEGKEGEGERERGREARERERGRQGRERERGKCWLLTF